MGRRLCGTSPGERRCRNVFETLTGYQWPSTRPVWLVNVTGRRLQLDGYCEALNIAFEYDGRQHRRFHRKYHKTKGAFHAQQQRDQLKDKLCRERGVHLIRVPSTTRDLYTFILDALLAAL